MPGYPVQINSLPPSDDFHNIVTPDIGTTPTGLIEVDGVGTASLIPYYTLVTAFSGDGSDVAAATRLQAGQPEVDLLNPEGVIELLSATAITDVYLVAVGNTSAGPKTAAPADYTGNAFIIANTDADPADWQAQMAHFVFDPADNVRRVRLTCTPIYGTNYMSINISGVSYA